MRTNSCSRYATFFFSVAAGCGAPCLDAAAAATYYVRPNHTTGSHTGTDYANAWDSIAGINWNAVNSGDTIRICGKHLSTKTPVVGAPGVTVNTRGQEVVIGIAKSGITLDGDCRPYTSEARATIYSATRFSAGKYRNWIDPDQDGVYETAYNNGYANNLLCEDGQPLSVHASGQPWLPGQYERQWAAGEGTIYYKPSGGLATDHRTTLHLPVPSLPATAADCAETPADQPGGVWDFEFTTWSDTNQDGNYELTTFQQAFQEYLIETDANQDNIGLLKWRHSYIGGDVMLPDASWTAGTQSYHYDAVTPRQSKVYYRPTSGTPADHHLYAPANTNISVFDASNVVIRNLRLFGGASGEISAYNADNLLIENNELQWGGHAIGISEDSDHGQLLYNEIHNLKCGSGIYMGSGGGPGQDPALRNNDDWRVAYNHIHDISQYGEACVYDANNGTIYIRADRHALANEGGNRNVYEFNHIHHSGGEGIAFYNWTSSGTHTTRDNIIRNNYIHDIRDLAHAGGCRITGDGNNNQSVPVCSNQRGIELGGDYRIPRPELITGNLVHHNILHNIGDLAFRFKSSSCPETGPTLCAEPGPTWRVFNNVVVGARRGMEILTASGPQDPPNINPMPYDAQFGAQFANNIFLDVETVASITVPAGGAVAPATTAFNNLFYNTGASPPAFTITLTDPPGGTTTGNSLATWKNQTGIDLNSSVANPQLVGQTGGFAADSDFRYVSATSPEFNGGAPVDPSPAPTDYLDNPIAGPPDIGAYELLYADLGIAIADSPDPVLQGQTVTYTITVNNNGPITATGVTVTGSLLADCNLGMIISGTSAQCVRTVTATTVGTLTQMVSVAATEVDLNTGNNSATATTTVQAAPDLQEAALTASVLGTNFLINDRVANSGGGSAAAFAIRYYLSTNATYEVGDTLLGSRTVTSLAAGASDPASSTTPTTLPIPSAAPGSYNIIALVDADNTVTEMNEGDNASAAPVSLASPDLSLSIADSPDPVLQGQTLTYTVTVMNLGPSTATGVTATGSPLTACSLGTIVAGANASCVRTVTPSTVGTLSQTMTAAAVEGDPITANNSATATTTVQAAPDLREATGALTASVSGTNFVIKDRVTNSGAASAAASVVRYYLSTNATWEATDTSLCSRSVPSLAVGASNPSSGTTTSTCAIPSVAAGGYNIIARVDDGLAVPESNESNNTTAVARSLTGKDLLPTAFTAVRLGSTQVTVNDTVINQGSQATGSFKIRYYLSTNTTYESGTDFALVTTAGGSSACERTVSSLAGGGSTPNSGPPPAACHKPSAAPNGVSYYVIVRDDSGSSQSEYNEANNTRATTGTLSW